jgi:O-succinylbenzoate synthase
MRINEITLRELHMKLVTPFETSMERTDTRRIFLIEAAVDDVIGWGECVAGETPSYSPETTETAWHILRDHLWPLLKGKEFGSAAEVWNCWRTFAGTTWPRADWKPPYGTRKPSRRAFPSQN